jgi:ectoine hydroxylase-related dioxygenase (phytanoyl-CoA dioxygenase family)
MRMSMHQEHIDIYHRDGYLELGQRIDVADCEQIRRHFDELDQMSEAPAEYQAEYDGEGSERRLRKLRRLVWNEPKLYGPVLNRAGALDIAEAIVGPGAVAVFHAAFLKPARIGTHVALHQDQALWNRVYTGAFSMWFALSQVNPGNGGLFGCPGSQTRGTIKHTADPDHPWHETLTYAAHTLGEPHQFRLKPGEAVIWDRNFAHGSAANTSANDRRGMVAVFADGSASGFASTDVLSLDELRALRGV